MSVTSSCVVFQLFQVYLKSHFRVENICYCLQLRLIFSLWTPWVYSSPQYSTQLCVTVWWYSLIVVVFVMLHQLCGSSLRLWPTEPPKDRNTALFAYLRKYLLWSYVWHPCHSPLPCSEQPHNAPHLSQQQATLCSLIWYLILNWTENLALGIMKQQWWLRILGIPLKNDKIHTCGVGV